ncbi:hypothetical protein BASA81_001948 [Batrachochytrium salamandrivorans]|nr:hypothetical protein BASA81_001948 [Batrachochytrium salamandrivorans]
MKRGLSLGGLDLTSPKHHDEDAGEEEEAGDVQFVRRFVPDLIAERLTTDGAICKQELAYYPNSVVGFFDVSGFSNLARQLEETEKRNLERNKNRKRNASNLITVSGKGAEELVNQLNDTLTQLIAVIRQSGGDIIKFAGDAILVVWICRDLEHLAEQVCIATECAVRCCALRSDSGLGLHVGIGAGELVGAHVGGKFGRWEYFIAGEACTQSAKAESFSKLDQVVVSPQAFELLCGMQRDLPVFTHMLVDQGHALIKSLLVSNDMLTRNTVQPKYSRLTDTCAKMAEGFVPGPVKEALKSSTIVPGGPRKLTVVFFLLLDVNLPTSFQDEDTKQRFLEECQSQALSVQDSAYHYWATLRQFILDDKGFVAIVCLGLPPYFHEDNAVRACKVARRLIKTHKIKAAAGICTGTVFCGIVGSAKRAEYSVAGSCINLAARLMCKAQPGEIWVDAQTKLEASSQLQFEKMPSLPFKGFDQPVDIYSPVFPNEEDEGDSIKPTASAASVGASAAAASTSFSSSSSLAAAAAAAAAAAMAPKGLVLRRSTQNRRDALVGMERPTGEISKLLFVGNEDEQSAKIGLLEGEAGSGKTKLVEWALAHNQAKRTVVTNADASEINTPFFVWRSVLQNLLASSPALVSSPLVRESASLSSLPPTATSKSASSSSSSLKNKFFPSAFRNSGSNGSSLELVPSQQQSQQPPQKKKFLSDKRRSSTESVASLGGRASGDQQNLEEMLQSVFPVSRVVLDEEEVGGGGSNGVLKGIAEDGDEDSNGVAAAVATATAEEVPAAEPKPTPSSSPYLLDRVVHDRRMRGRRLSALQQILPNLAVPTGVVQSSPSDNEEDGSSPNQSAIEIMLVLLEEIGNVENTLIVIENAHSMDKWSWELLYRIHCHLPGTKVRFLVTYRPFEALLDHPLNQLLNHHQLNLATHAYMSSPLRRVSSSIRIPPPTPNAAGTVPPQRNSGLQATAAANVVANAAATTTAGTNSPSHIPPVPPRSVSGGGLPPQGLLSKTFHRFGDAKPFRSRHGSITSVASGSANNNNNYYASGTPLSASLVGTQPTPPPLLPLDDVIKISIPALTLRETSALLSNQFHVSTGPKLLQFLRNTSKGNPRALFDCYRALQDQGLFEVDPESGIAEENTSLEEIGDLVFAIPQHVRARLQQQFDQLPMQEQLLLKLASVIGPTVSIPLLTQLCNKLEANNLMPMRGLDVAAGLKQLKTKGMLRPLLLSDQQQQQRLPSPLYGEGEEEDWGFDNDNTRFIVYSQMLHTFRCQVHSYILAVFQERPLAWRLREDPTLLGNHAVGAERPLLAFQCFQEAMRRAVLKDEPLDKGRRLWQSCSDVLDGEGGGHSEDTLQSLALRIHIEVLFAQIAISNSAWEEAKLSLTKALERVEEFNQLAGTDIPTLYTDASFTSSDGGRIRFTACGGGFGLNSWWQRLFATSTSKRAKGNGECSPHSKSHEDVLWDPLETREDEVDPIVLVKAHAKLGLSLLEQMRVFELDTLSRANAIKTYSEHELGHRYYSVNY